MLLMGSSRSGFNKLIDDPVTRASQKVLKLYNSYNSYNSYNYNSYITHI
jgi:hypothetical protein